MDQNHSNLINRTNMVGGQAVIEGVMMKKGDSVAIAVRKEDGTVEVKKETFGSVRKKAKIFDKPIIRGIIAFIESLILSFKTLSVSTDMLDLEEDKNKKGEKKNAASTIFIMIISIVLGLAIALVLFAVIPTYIAGQILPMFLEDFQNEKWYGPALALTEGVLKVVIFIGYLLVVSLMKDIKRTFQYHGAEHKAIACFESGRELTIENARKCTRFHPRCGTSFIFVMIMLSIIASCFIPATLFWAWRVLIKVLILPIIMGIGYEIIMFAGQNDNAFSKVISAPGLWMQRITTKEPTDDQLGIAIAAIKSSVPEFYPKFNPSEFDIPENDNRDHIANIGKKYPKKAPLYSVPSSKAELFYREAECAETSENVTLITNNVNKKAVSLQFKKYTPFVAPVVEEATEEAPNEEVTEA